MPYAIPPGPQVSCPTTPCLRGIFSSNSLIAYFPTLICAITKSTSVNASSGSTVAKNSISGAFSLINISQAFAIVSCLSSSLS